MKVKDLIAQLSEIDQNLEVYGYAEDESISSHDKPFRFFLVDDVSVSNAILSRGSDGSPSAIFDNGAGSQQLALINICSDF